MEALYCDALIFDLDGVLVDSNDIAERHWRLWAERRGVAFDKIASTHHGRPTVQTMREVAPDLDVVSEAQQKENAEADDTNGLVAFPGAHRLLFSLPEKRWAIVTSGTRRTATRRLNHTLLPVPELLVTADDIQHGKPHPEPYLKAIAELGVVASRCVVIEDAPAGIQAARSAGAQIVGIASTNTPAALSAADVIVSSLDEVTVKVTDRGLQVTFDSRSATD